jgi:hypothetical protein
MAESGEGFLSDGGIDWGEVKGRKEGERGVLIGRGFMAITHEKLVGALLRRVPFPERRGSDYREEESDMVVPPVSSEEKEKRKRGNQSGGGAPRAEACFGLVARSWAPGAAQ